MVSVCGKQMSSLDYSLLNNRCEFFFLIRFLTILQMQIFFYNPDDFDNFQMAISENRIIGAMAIFFQVS